MLKIADKTFHSRLIVGTGKFGRLDEMAQAIVASGTELVTLALRRVDDAHQEDNLLQYVQQTRANLLPNTSGARTAAEAVLLAEMGRELLQTNWVKLEIHPDPNHLLPDPIETFEAAKELVKLGFVVLPYVNADPVLCKRLEDIGTAAVMPLGAPIGTNAGLKTRNMLEIIVKYATVPVVVDAGLGLPSHAADALEMGADAVLVNTAIAVAGNPVAMAEAFKQAVEAGRKAFEAGPAAVSPSAIPSSPIDLFV